MKTTELQVLRAKYKLLSVWLVLPNASHKRNQEMLYNITSAVADVPLRLMVRIRKFWTVTAKPAFPGVITCYISRLGESVSSFSIVNPQSQ